MNTAFEDTRKDIAYIRRLCSAGQMKSTGLSMEAARNLAKLNDAHNLIESSLNRLLFNLRARTMNPFSRHHGRGRHNRKHHQGGSFFDSYY
jgi:hypothetical protein